MRLTPKLLGVLAFLALAVAVLVSLGTWQLFRLQQQNAANAQLLERTEEPAITWSTNVTLKPQEMEFRVVEVSGRWDHTQTMLIANRAQYQMKGVEFVTPLLPDAGGPAILVNRGWAPEFRVDEVRRALDAEPRATVTGLARTYEHLQPGREIGTGWTRLDPAVMGKQLPYEVVQWQLVQGRAQTAMDLLNSPTEFPVQRYTITPSTTPHLEYALTWYGLAAVLVGTAFIRLWPRHAAPRPIAGTPAAQGLPPTRET